jgi:hypothetical protein
MEKIKKRCIHCRRSFTPCRNPEQSYCHQRSCQNHRKCVWRRRKQFDDSDYRENQRRANKAWQQRHVAYWQRYRIEHPDYTQQNRTQQHGRDQQRKGVSSLLLTPLAKSDALSLKKSIKSGTYRLISGSNPSLAKSDALTLEISLISES